jgi:hypothetical protein
MKPRSGERRFGDVGSQWQRQDDDGGIAVLGVDTFGRVVRVDFWIASW